MKKYSIKLLLLSLFLSIVLSVIIATSVNLRLDELGALWNVLLPPVLGLVTLILVLIIFLFIKRTAMRKMLLISFIAINILTGIILNIQFNRLLNYNKTVVSVKQDSKRDFHFASYVASDASVEEVTIKNKDGFLSNDHLTFSFLENKWRNEGDSKNKIKCNDNHDQVTIHIKNDRKVNLNITKVAFSKKGLWAISKINNLTVDESAFPVCVRPGNYVDVTVDFTADAINKRVESSWWKAIFKLQFSLLKVAKSINYELPVLTNCLNLNGVLYLYTDDGVQNVKSVYLNSLWQYRGEGDWEPDLQRVLYAFNIKTKVGFKYFDNDIDGERIVPNSDEIAASIFEKANTHLPVKITQIAAYHACCSTKESDTLKYYYQKDLVFKTLFHHDPGGAQILLPKMIKAPGMIFTEFDPEGPFGLQMGSSNSDRKKNYKNKIGLRIWKVINKYDKQVPDCYILGGDYLGSPGTNYDYQDNVYFVQNIKPIYN